MQESRRKSSSPLWYDVAGQSHPGRERLNNEDALCLDTEHGVIAVADGMGGQSAGEVASAIAIATLRTFVSAGMGQDAITWPFGFDARQTFGVNLLRTAFRLANAEVIKAADQDLNRIGMGTTMTAVWLQKNDQATFTYAHVGDTRLYLFREASLRQLTEDHTLVQEQIRVGLIGEEASKTHPMRHVITNSLGAKEGIRIDVGHELLELGDLLMLCTDGLHQMLPLSELEALLSSGADLAKLGAELIDRANAAGGPDNITVALIRRTE